ncbi:MAG: PAS domain-containing sensor histidine kinase, partial [Alphaproteobacteria bacterium HGW-Alphaproteobacteria-2]
MNLPAAATLWASLPVPAVLVGADDRILSVNGAAEQFFNLGARALEGVPVWDRLVVDAP